MKSILQGMKGKAKQTPAMPMDFAKPAKPVKPMGEPKMKKLPDSFKMPKSPMQKLPKSPMPKAPPAVVPDKGQMRDKMKGLLDEYKNKKPGLPAGPRPSPQEKQKQFNDYRRQFKNKRFV